MTLLSVPIGKFQLKELVYILLAVNACIFLSKSAVTIWRKWHQKRNQAGLNIRPSTPALEKRPPGKAKETQKTGGISICSMVDTTTIVLTTCRIKNGFRLPSNDRLQHHVQTGMCIRRSRFHIGLSDMDRWLPSDR